MRRGNGAGQIPGPPRRGASATGNVTVGSVHARVSDQAPRQQARSSAPGRAPDQAAARLGPGPLAAGRAHTLSGAQVYSQTSFCLAANHSIHRAKRTQHPRTPMSWMASYISHERYAYCRRRGSEVTPEQEERRSPSSLDQAGCLQPSTTLRYSVHIHLHAYAPKDNVIFLLDRPISGTPLLTQD